MKTEIITDVKRTKQGSLEVFEGYVKVYEEIDESLSEIWVEETHITRLQEEDALVDAQLLKEDILQGNLTNFKREKIS